MKIFCSSIALLLFFTQLNAQTLTEVNGRFLNENGQAYTGAYAFKNEDGVITKEVMIENGLLHGSVSFFENGVLMETGEYSQGQKNGKWIQYNTSGIRTGEAYYKDGLKDGIWTVWDDNGIKRYHMVYSAGKKIDVWKMWDENSNLVSERYYGN